MIGIVLKYTGLKACVSGWLALSVDSVAWWYPKVCRNGSVHLCCESVPRNGGTCTAGGCQLSNINMCTPFNTGLKQFNQFLFSLSLFFPQTQCYVKNIKNLAGSMQLDLIINLSGSLARWWPRKTCSEVINIDLEEVESHQGAYERQKCLDVIHNLPLPFVLYLEVVMLGIGGADEKDEQISKLKW